MKGVIALALLILASMLIYEVVIGNSGTIIDNLRGITNNTSQVPSDNSNVLSPDKTPQIAVPNNSSTGVAWIMDNGQ